ncbi:olfactory receptor 2B6-like [Hyla sarda]|uniref:olfactory receptor 2B6-like n=1 Tax=Hyla sarda TaxID=327740 RepID=UPI0024C21F32|nr:olfactory receptor 2B6-like [Hyla sarda]
MDLNRTIVTEIILLGFSWDLTISRVLFVLFFVIYFITVFGNGLLILVVLTNSHLHTPMYFFLCMLSFLDLCNSTCVVPRFLIDLFSIRRTISVGACAIQFYTILLMGGTECLLLTVMAYDRYVAICRPLHYTVIMRWSICYRVMAIVWISSFFIFVFPSLTMPMPLCYPNQINHFMCEILAIRKLTCTHFFFSEILVLGICFTSILLPFVFIIVSYACIISSVLKIQSAGRSKAFSTCTSHISVVALFFGTGMIMYFGPSADYSTNQGKYISVFYNVICPMLNPLIYSLNNKDVKEQLQKMGNVCTSSNYHNSNLQKN